MRFFIVTLATVALFVLAFAAEDEVSVILTCSRNAPKCFTHSLQQLSALQLLLVGVLLGSCAGNPARKTRQTEQRPLEFSDVIPGSRFSQRGFNGTWLTETEFLYRNSEGDYTIYNVVDSTNRLFLARDALSGWSGASYTFSRDYTKVLVRYSTRSIFRHSIVAKYAVYNIASGTFVDVSNAEELNVCTWSPVDSNTLAFVKDNDVYVKKLDGVETRLTNDGVPGVIYNGVPDWVYEEEVLGSGAALWFSTDGGNIAIASFDDTLVNESMYFMYGEPGNANNQYFEEIQLRYPKAGMTNPVVALRVLDMSTSGATWRHIPTPVDIVSSDHILGTVSWYNDNHILALWLNRRQNIATLQSCIVGSEITCREIIRLSEPSGWVSVNAPRCYPTANVCLMIANSEGWYKVWKYDFTQQQTSIITPTAVTVSSIYGYDEVNDNLYYLAVPGSNPEQRHVFRDNTCLTCSSQSPEGAECIYASASFSRDFSYYALTCSGPTPSYTHLTRASDNSKILAWEENLSTRTSLTAIALPQVHYLKVPVKGGFEASVKIKVPANVNFPSGNDQKYPMIVYVYGGPNSARVTASFGVGFGDFMVSGHHVIEVQIDGRGTANQGTDFLFTLNNHLGTVEIEDQIDVAKYLQENYDFIDADRTGIWGWSYGGYATAMALAKDTERVFQCGISVAPVISWIYYDSIYTERYMGLPNPTFNEAGYNASDITRNIEEFKHHDFLLIHGNADDNVHFQNSMMLSRVLQKANILFEQMSYPDEAHGLNGVSRHLYHLMESFWMQCLSIEE
ncbi:venom dipeptidyl peptidase 4 [Phlebotomus argentipes]|uniref:venom dipeptidyl peptidase 4 n=1 Tax=Phlebotomus argentipes TaxID=94469 RepID=UPI002892D192|nr:venom dipeptidyl peptidase 4 [Phlebotomus argentipes]